MIHKPLMHWRDLPEQADAHIVGMMLDDIMERREFGRETYGEVFQGEPIQHAWEEALDLLFYLAIEFRRRNYEFGLIRRLVAEETL